MSHFSNWWVIIPRADWSSVFLRKSRSESWRNFCDERSNWFLMRFLSFIVKSEWKEKKMQNPPTGVLDQNDTVGIVIGPHGFDAKTFISKIRLEKSLFGTKSKLSCFSQFFYTIQNNIQVKICLLEKLSKFYSYFISYAVGIFVNPFSLSIFLNFSSSFYP